VGWTVPADSVEPRRSRSEKIVGGRDDDGHDDTWAAAYDGLVVDDLEEPRAYLDVGEVTTEYGVFNDAAVWEPLFASGEVHESLREVLERPLYASEVLEAAARHARLANEERALDVAKVDKFGYVVVKTRRVVRSPWADVPLDEQARALGEF